jgi:hypothetical protein
MTKGHKTVSLLTLANATTATAKAEVVIWWKEVCRVKKGDSADTEEHEEDASAFEVV